MMLKSLAAAMPSVAMVSLVGCILIGCSRDEGAATAPEDPTSPRSYLKDEAFMNTVKAQNAERKSIMAKRASVQREYEAACAQDPNGARAKALKEELDRCAAEFEANRLKTTEIVRERLRPKANNETK